MDYMTILLRTLFISFIIFFGPRIVGKHEFNRFTAVDFIIFIMIAELAVMSIVNPSLPLMYSLLPIVLLLVAQFLFTFLSLKSERLKKSMSARLTAKPRKNLTINEILMQLRKRNVDPFADVEFALYQPILEQGTEVSRMPIPLILDGKVQEEQLQKINQTPLWIRQQMRRLGYRNIKKISYCALRGNDTFFVEVEE
ncbi:DUF421 domain-containing protein [bacterium LRH843]|nr:DUF421 domain-containing protein [bacterium LRH843]